MDDFPLNAYLMIFANILLQILFDLHQKYNRYLNSFLNKLNYFSNLFKFGT